MHAVGVDQADKTAASGELKLQRINNFGESRGIPPRGEEE